ncbi:MAG: hypothetical protein V3S18_02925, partial [Dehalococcoidia bacterium]
MTLDRVPHVRTTVAIALVFLFGLQLLRDLLAGLAFYVHGWLDAGTTVTALFAVGISLAALLAPVAARALGPPRALAGAGLALAFTRVAAQFSIDPAADLALNVLGVGAFGIFVALAVARVRGSGQAAGMALATGIMAGIAADTAIKGLLGSVDLSWHPGPAAQATTMVLAAALAVLLWPLHPARGALGGSGRGRLAAIWPVAVIGPVLTLGFIHFQNVGQQTARTGLDQPAAFALVSLSNALGLGLVAIAPRLGRRGAYAVGVPLW